MSFECNENLILLPQPLKIIYFIFAMSSPPPLPSFRLFRQSGTFFLFGLVPLALLTKFFLKMLVELLLCWKHTNFALTISYLKKFNIIWNFNSYIRCIIAFMIYITLLLLLKENPQLLIAWKGAPTFFLDPNFFQT